MDVEEIVGKIMAMSEQQVLDNLHKLIGNYPNTYSYTKSLTEKALAKKRGNLNIVIIRPTIVAGALKEPFPGWTDTLAAAGGLTLLIGTVLSESHTQSDSVTVDF